MRLNTDKVKDVMKVNNLTIDDISARTGIYKKSIEWILDSGFASEEAVERVADVVGVEVNDIYRPDTLECTENVIEFIKDSKRATVTFSQGRHKNKIKKMADRNPRECQIIRENKDGSIMAHIPVTWIKIFPQREYTEEQRNEMGERLNRNS